MIGRKKVMVKWKQVRRFGRGSREASDRALASSFSTPLNSSLQGRKQLLLCLYIQGQRMGPFALLLTERNEKRFTHPLPLLFHHQPSTLLCDYSAAVTPVGLSLWSLPKLTLQYEIVAAAAVYWRPTTQTSNLFRWFIVHKLGTPRRIVAEDAFFKYH